MKSRLASVLMLAVAIVVGSSSAPLSSSSVHASFIPLPPPLPIRVLVMGGDPASMKAADTVFPTDLPGSVDRTLTIAAFNLMTPTQLRAAYDVILFTWSNGSDATINADWTTRILPYLKLGGGVLFESNWNIGDLAPAVVGTTSTTFGPYSIDAAIPGLTDGIVGDFVNDHFTLVSWDVSFTQFISGGGIPLGIAGQFGGGRIVVTGPDQDYHAMSGGTSTEINQYNFLVNEFRWSSPSFARSVASLKADVLTLVPPLTASQASVLNQILDQALVRFNNGQGGGAVSLLRSFNTYVGRYPLSGAQKTLLLDQTAPMIRLAQLLPVSVGP